MTVPDTILKVLSTHSLKQVLSEVQKVEAHLAEEFLAHAKEVLEGVAVEEFQKKASVIRDTLAIMNKSSGLLREELVRRGIDETKPKRPRRKAPESPEKLVVTPTPKAQGKAS